MARGPTQCHSRRLCERHQRPVRPFGVYSTAINVLYNKNQRFFLLVNRLRLLVSRTHTFWLLDIDFELELGLPEGRSSLLGRIAEMFRQSGHWRATARSKSLNRMEVVLDEQIGLVFVLDDEYLHISLDRRLMVPAHAYDEYQRKLKRIISATEAVVHPTQVRCGIQVFFREGTPNPYYGFFVRRIPSQVLQDFRVRFGLDRTSDCRIEADKEHVGVEATNVAELFDATTQVLSQSALPVGEPA